ncbi:DUF4105 domain-containing protein [Breznakiella homolactica]|uniref:DUF4105 domain-containing protein n=1 Tax=Breznakiella homolactica TaxID=2798577 RepID=A0A7T7XJ80_9SPIR|nr:DUF4105 domain-containing protein [Breznakiella homolactica]QQO07366.1 DUF4105 domain-containing protein [Breznakiella homolactica]
MKKIAEFILLTVLFAAVPGAALFSDTLPEAAAKTRGDYLTVKVAVMGPGTELYFWWGHIALVIEDELSGQSRFYDYGLFSFDNENFFLNFALGRLLYSAGVSPTDANVRQYIRNNRDVVMLTLDLPAQKKEEVLRFAENNVLPENRDYYYHHFKDNCATRIRDIVDLATDGQFFDEFGAAPGRFTLRQHVRRHTWFSPFFDWLLNFLMGQDIDTPITVWEEMFLPSEIDRNLQNFRYTDSQGQERSLVVSREIINSAVNRPPVLENPRKQWPRELVFSLVICGILGVFYWLRNRKPRAGRILLGSSQAALGLFFGIAGSLSVFLTFFTDHDYTYHNCNLFIVHPLILAAVPLGIIMAADKGKNWKRTPEWYLRLLWTVVFAGGIVSMAIKLLPWFWQQNQVTQALVMPFALVLSFIPPWIGGALRRRKHG